MSLRLGAVAAYRFRDDRSPEVCRRHMSRALHFLPLVLSPFISPQFAAFRISKVADTQLPSSFTEYFSHRQPDQSLQRQSRPPLQQRQSSYSKRHSSFDTPREVPFPAGSPSHSRAISSPFDVRELEQRASVSRTDSDSTVVTAGHRTPGPVPHDVVHSATQVGHVPTPGTPGAAQNDYYDVLQSSMAHSSTGCVENDDGSSNIASDHMTYIDKAPSEGHEGPSFSRTSPEFSHNENRNAGFWDSSHLRPELLNSPTMSKSMPRDIAGPSTSHQNHHTSYPGPNSPFYLENKEGYEIMSPTPTRPSSAASLPLPSQMPFHALPTAPGQSRGSLGLPSVKEQDPSHFSDSGGVSPENEIISPPPRSSSSLLGSQTYPMRTSSSSPGALAALFESADRNGRLKNPRFSGADTASTVSTMLSSSSSRTSQMSSASSFFPPTPPTVHSPPPPSEPSILEDDPEEAKEREGKRQSAPYEPFLSHAPPPADSYITVETCEVEYRLIVRLPGYRRDAM